MEAQNCIRDLLLLTYLKFMKTIDSIGLLGVECFGGVVHCFRLFQIIPHVVVDYFGSLQVVVDVFGLFWVGEICGIQINCPNLVTNSLITAIL